MTVCETILTVSVCVCVHVTERRCLCDCVSELGLKLWAQNFLVIRKISVKFFKITVNAKNL